MRKGVRPRERERERRRWMSVLEGTGSVTDPAYYVGYSKPFSFSSNLSIAGGSKCLPRALHWR